MSLIPVGQTAFSTLPDCGGAYGLLINLERGLLDAGPAGAPGTLMPGRYLYAGSANGPGGIRARVTRHARSKKQLHWHIDKLTTAGTIFAVHTWQQQRECEIVDACLATGQAAIAMPGFGSSDCRNCAAHLVRLTPCFDPRLLAARLGAAQSI